MPDSVLPAAQQRRMFARAFRTRLLNRFCCGDCTADFRTQTEPERTTKVAIVAARISRRLLPRAVDKLGEKECMSYSIRAAALPTRSLIWSTIGAFQPSRLATSIAAGSAPTIASHVSAIVL
jgi:hypothetical protein